MVPIYSYRINANLLQVMEKN